MREAIDRGQTVFLASHILSEVEALCRRVAILRAGQLIETGTLADMRHLSALTMDIEFEGPPPDLASVPGVSGITVTGKRLRCHVSGPVEPLLRVLATASVRHLVSREPSQEELFLAHYGAPLPDAA